MFCCCCCCCPRSLLEDLLMLSKVFARGHADAVQGLCSRTCWCCPRSLLEDLLMLSKVFDRGLADVVQGLWSRTCWCCWKIRGPCSQIHVDHLELNSYHLPIPRPSSPISLPILSILERVSTRVVLVMVVSWELFSLVTSAICVRITSHRSEITRIVYHMAQVFVYCCVLTLSLIHIWRCRRRR